MRCAIRQAELAMLGGDVPVGCVIARRGEVLACAHNLRERAQDPTAHAEIVALRAAAVRTGSWRLCGACVYVTLEPCPMCAGALINSRVARVVYGCDDPKAGALRSLYRLGSDARLNHRLDVVGGVLATSCADLLSSFFARLRQGPVQE
ncbi:MAG: nucleoside deaminase [Proteobacteria bacterium]|nr:nucleoside deaminase [Pseudomonadota bacterium]